MKQNKDIKIYLNAAATAAERQDVEKMFSHLRLVLTILEAEGFNTESLLPSKRVSFSSFLGTSK